MNPIATSQRALVWLCVCPDDESSILIKFARPVVPFILFSFFATGFMTSVAFFSKFVSVDLKEALYALLQIGGTVDGLYIMFVGYVSRKKINKTIRNLLKIYETCTFCLKLNFYVQNEID